MDFHKIDAILERGADRESGVLYEHEVYEILGMIGIGSMPHYFHKMTVPLGSIAASLPHAGPFVAKIVAKGLTHKTELGGLAFNVTKGNAVEIAEDLVKKVSGKVELEGILFVEQLEHQPDFGNEILLGLYQDAFFGTCLAFGFGGTSTEYFKKITKRGCANIIVPASTPTSELMAQLKETPIANILEGKVRGRKSCYSMDKMAPIVGAFCELGKFYSDENPSAKFVIDEMEINPAVVRDEKFIALDGVLVCHPCESGNDTTKKPLDKIHKLLSPKTLAIAGASGKNKANFCNVILSRLIDNGFPKESIYLLHPKEDEIEGIKCHKEPSDVLTARKGEPVDCFIVGIPAKFAGELVKTSIDLYFAHSIQILSAGFGETKAGAGVEAELKKEIEGKNTEKRPVINGPNTMGNVYRDINTLFTFNYKSSGTGKGKKNVALVCQSGAFLITRISDMANVVAPEIAISVGNQMDLSVVDFFEHLLSESDIDVYGLYIEGLKEKEGSRLGALARKAAEQKKFTIVYRAGRTEEGKRAAKGHTAAMSGDYDMFVDFLSASGVIVADTPNEFDDLVMLASHSRELFNIKARAGRKFGVAALSNAGFEKCMIADHLMAKAGGVCEFSRYSDETKKKIEEALHESGVLSIVDQMEVLDLSPMTGDAAYEKIIRATLEDENTDIGIYSMVPETVMLNTCEKGTGHNEDFTREGSIFSRLVSVKRDIKKPFIVSIESGWKYDGFARALLDAGIPAFRDSSSAANAVAKYLNTIR